MARTLPKFPNFATLSFMYREMHLYVNILIRSSLKSYTNLDQRLLELRSFLTPVLIFSLLGGIFNHQVDENCK